MATEIDLSGLIAFVEGVEEAFEAGNDRAANFVADLARQLCPVDEGDLRGTIRVEDGQQPTTRLILAGDPSATRDDGRPVDYAPHVEYGTASSPAQPFMTPAANAIRPELEITSELQALAARCRR